MGKRFSSPADMLYEVQGLTHHLPRQVTIHDKDIVWGRDIVSLLHYPGPYSNEPSSNPLQESPPIGKAECTTG